MENLASRIRLFWESAVYPLPRAYDEEFAREYHFINLTRVRFVSIVTLLFLGFMIYRDLNLLSLPDSLNHRSLFHVHVVFAAGLLALFIIAQVFAPISPAGVQRWHQTVMVAAAGFVLAMCVAVSWAYPYGALSIYVIGCFAVASIFFLPPGTGFVLYALAHLAFIVGQTHHQSSHGILWVHYVNGSAAAVVAWGVSLALFNTRARDFMNQKLIERNSHLDGLTGIANRRQFDAVLESEWRRAVRSGAPLSLVMADIDFFKAYNDAYGHLAGDDCLKKVARRLNQELKRAGDLAARYGGEEFGIILPNTPGPGAAAVAERLRLAVAGLNIPHSASAVSPHVTISLGVSTVIPDRHTAPESLVARADQALYRAKQEGRNRFTAG